MERQRCSLTPGSAYQWLPYQVRRCTTPFPTKEQTSGTSVLRRERCGETVTPRFCSVLFLSRSLAVSPSPFGCGDQEREKEASHYRGVEVSRVAVYGNLTGAWFSKRAKDLAPGRTFVRSFVRSLRTGVHARRTQEQGGGGRSYDRDGDIKTQYPMGRESATRRDRMETTARWKVMTPLECTCMGIRYSPLERGENETERTDQMGQECYY